ncbi:dTDP-4-dehydrorhamnose reductase [Patulibacter sp. NPDC049589]|uniref:dTDP-4-dehydrorhamnose reductase n=1 Tax=Patulibacter sp. NPDC049589 TaxID=3154731 RepID=UPI0034309946
MGFSQQRGVQRLGPNFIVRPNKGALDRSDDDGPDAAASRRRMIVVGATGMLGHRVADVARVHGWDVVEAPRVAFDITDLGSTTVWLEKASPAVVVNCAAYTNVDAAEEDEAAALRVNGEGAGNLAKATAALGARIIHVSTDYVFRGDATEPYAEDAPVDPQGAYGRTKLVGEQLVAEHNPDHLICRTSWLFGEGGGNFVDTMLRLAADRDEVSVVADQQGCPTWTGHLAPAIVAAAATDARGIAHLCGSGRTTWHGLAQETFALADTGTTALPVTTDAFPRPAPRPAWSVMASTRPDVPALPAWQDGLRGHLLAANRLKA